MTTSSTSNPREMASAYDPQVVEQPLYEWWETNGYFRPSKPGAKPFTIIMPPPNLTGELHLGHALTVSIEDALTRWHRMLGDDTLWLPGVDHAAIAVNAIIERDLTKEGLSRHDIGREAFLERTGEFVKRSRSRITLQHRRLGASADWGREAFTMDEEREKSVRATFKRLYDDGLIYRADRLINWCVDCESAISDIEVEYGDEPGAFWWVSYEIADAQGKRTGEVITIATTRPETIPADAAVAVNPDDDRWKHLIGQHCIVPAGGRLIPIIADAAVSIEGGSGALKVTPGHDPVDFEIGERHDLPTISIMKPDGTLNDEAGPYAGLERFEARKKIVADLEAAGRLVKIESYTHSIGHCQRSGTIVEPLISLQWWVDAKTLATPAIAKVEDGSIKFVPPRFERVYLHWMENIRDWCISRQIWWGHRIPVWYCANCDHITVHGTVGDPKQCEDCGSADLHQDPDTLDTWFSSGLWPHSTLGWPEDADDLRRFYPTQVMETGYDIIFFWVARMIMLSLYNMQGEIPFGTVYLHGLVRAADGAKMSKSRGNVIDPLESVAKFGTDSLRFAMISGTSPGNDQRITDDKLEAGRNLSNKLWNASRFALTMVEDGDDLTLPASGTGSLDDRWILSRLAAVTRDVDRLWGQFELAEALRQARDFFWDEFADWYIELAKVRVRAGDRTPIAVLVHVVDQVLRLLHPFMPYVTEEIWQRLATVRPDAEGAPALIVARYPVFDAARLDDDAERMMIAVQDFIRGVRNIRAEKRVDAGRFVEAYIAGADATEAARSMAPAIEQLARVQPLHVVTTADEAPSEGVVTAVLAVGQVILPMAGLFDVAVERERLSKQIVEIEAEVGRQEAKLSNEQFTARAPAAVVAKEQERLATARGRLNGLRASLAELG
ncbi:MAG: valine--tRNA ligase [Dehalococcoidia bacterium]|nr:valine--tRNA ligase [Dehalococcoidia bacterium]